MSRHSSISSYYQPSSRPDSPAPYSSSSSSLSNPQHPLHLQPPNQPPPPQQQQPPPPPPPPRNQKADQILQNFYVKVIQIVILARVTHPDSHASLPTRKGSLRGVPLVKKTSKWFNLELEDLDIYKEDAKFWRAIAITDSPPTMLVELLLDTSDLAPNQMLVLVDENNRKNRVDVSSGVSSTASTPLGQARTRRNIILESWSLNLSNTPPDPVPEPPAVYKKSIIFFRSLFAYMRLLPAYQLYRRLRKQNSPLRIGFRVSRGHGPEESVFRESEIGIEVPLVEGETRPMLSEYRFGQVDTPLGAFSLKVTYRSNCEFHVDESEAVLSSRFIDMDENYFTPTIVAHSQESVRSMRRPSTESTRRPLSSTPLARRPSNDMYTSGNYQEHFSPIPTLRPRRNSVQSLQQQRSGDYSSSQSSVSSLGTRMSRRGSSGAPGGVFTPLDQAYPGGTPPFSVTHGGHAAVAKHYVDPIMESPPFKLGTSQSSDSRRPLSSTFSPFKSPSLSSSPSPSYLEARPPSLSSRPSSIHLHRSPSSSSISRVQMSQQGSGVLGLGAKPGATGAISSTPTGGANLLSTSVKSNASSSTSAPRVTSSFGHRHDSSGRRASSESLPPGRGNRNSIIGVSSLFQFTPDDDDVGAFVRMLDTPEPLKMFGKAGASGIGSSFGGAESLSGSALRSKATLDRFQQLKHVNTHLSESMSASQILAKEDQQTATATALGPRRSTLGDIETGSSSSSGLSFPTHTVPTVPRHTQSLSHQPGTPSPLHSEIPVYPKEAVTGRSIPVHPHQSSTGSGSGSTPSKRHSWLTGGHGSRGSNMGSIAFRHGSLDQGKDLLGMEEAMGRIGVTGDHTADIAFGSFPEDVHHQHSLYSAPLLKTMREGDGAESGGAAAAAGMVGSVDPRPIPSGADLYGAGSSATRPGRLLRLGSGSSMTNFTLPRLRTRRAGDDDSLNEVDSADGTGDQEHHRQQGSRRQRRAGGRGMDDDDDDDEDEEDEDEEEDEEDVGQSGRGARSGHDKHRRNQLNDDDDMLFIMSELSPGSNSGQETLSTMGAGVGGGMMTSSAPSDRGQTLSSMMPPPLAGALMSLRSQSQSPHRHGAGVSTVVLGTSGGSGSGRSTSPGPGPPSHLRIFGRSSSSSSNGASASTSASHSRGGSSNGNGSSIGNNNGTTTSAGLNSVENLHLMRRSGSVDDYLAGAATGPLGSASSGVVGGGGMTMDTFQAMLGGRRMSRGGSERGVSHNYIGSSSSGTAGSGAAAGSGGGGGGGGGSQMGSGNTSGVNSFHSDTRGW